MTHSPLPQSPAFPDGPPGWPLADEGVREALAAAFASGDWGRYHGAFAGALIERLQRMHEVGHAVLCSSGTIAVELALRGLKVGPGDEVILAGYDFPGNFRAIEAIGALPVLVDLAPGSWSLDAGQLEEAISPQTRAVVVSHLHGSLADMRAIMEIAQRRGIGVVEDACQSPGAIVQGRMAGAWGDAGVLSFGGSKLLTAGRGGAILTNRADVVQRMRVFSDRGNDAFPLSELQAAVLAPQCDRLAERNQARLQNVQRLVELCGGNERLQPLRLPTDGSQPSFYKMGWLVGGSADDSELSHRRAQLVAPLRTEGIAMDAGFRGFVKRSASRCRTVGPLDRAARAAAATIVLHHPALLQPSDYIDRLAATINHIATSG